MPLSPEEIEAHQFREVVRGYDTTQVKAALAGLAGRYRAALARRRSPSDAQEEDASDEITRLDFDDALQGYDKQDVKLFLDAAVADLQTLTDPGGGLDVEEPAGTSEPDAPLPGGERVLVRSAREIASAIRQSAQREAAEMRALAAEEAAKVIEDAWEEIAQDSAARAAADEERAAALRAQSEREMSELRTEATRVAQAAVDELRVARSRRSEADAHRGAAAQLRTEAQHNLAKAEADRAAAAELRTEAQHTLAEASALVGEQRERAKHMMDEARQVAAQVVEDARREAAELRDEAQRRLAEAAEELEQVQGGVVEAMQEAREIRALAVQEADALKAEAERALADADARAVEVDEDRQVLQQARQDLEATGVLLVEMGERLEAQREASNEQTADAVRRLEDRILAAVGEIQEDFHHSGHQAATVVSEAGQRLRGAAEALRISRSDPADDGAGSSPAGT